MMLYLKKKNQNETKMANHHRSGNQFKPIMNGNGSVCQREKKTILEHIMTGWIL